MTLGSAVDPAEPQVGQSAGPEAGCRSRRRRELSRARPGLPRQHDGQTVLLGVSLAGGLRARGITELAWAGGTVAISLAIVATMVGLSLLETREER